MARKPRLDSRPQQTAQVTGQAAVAVDQNGSAAGVGAQAPVNDAPPEQKRDAEAPETTAGAAEVAEAAKAPDLAGCEFVTLAFPLSAGLIPPQALKVASIVVRSKAERGRRRAGFAFTREETAIPYPDLTEDQIAALAGDAELVVSLRVPKPA